MPINQPESALARADSRIRELREKMTNDDGFDLAEALPVIDLALGALNFAGNSQQRLIDACAEQVSYYEAALRVRRLSLAETALLDAHRAAIAHASGPGID